VAVGGIPGFTLVLRISWLSLIFDGNFALSKEKALYFEKM
jgi:hypothetical protein